MKLVAVTISIMIFMQSIPVNAKSLSLCDIALDASQDALNLTDNFTSYLSKLLNEGVIDLYELQTFVGNLERQNPVSNVLKLKAQIRSEYLYHSQTLQSYIDSAQLDHQQLTVSLKKLLEEQKRAQTRKEQSAEKTKDAYVEMQFSPVHTPAKLKHSFEMMVTPVTQWMWLSLMGNNPSGWYRAIPTRTEINDVQSLVINGKQIEFWPDRPVNAIGWCKAIQFANKLSIERGLQPAYIENSCSRDSAGINAPNGNIYQTEGYRLPTLEEIQAMAEEGLNGLDGKLDKNYRFQPNLPVGEAAPLLVGGYVFYDLHSGGPREWLHDDRIEDVKRPILTKKDHAFAHGRVVFNMIHNDLGFRLVRTIKPKN